MQTAGIRGRREINDCGMLGKSSANELEKEPGNFRVFGPGIRVMFLRVQQKRNSRRKLNYSNYPRAGHGNSLCHRVRP